MLIHFYNATTAAMDYNLEGRQSFIFSTCEGKWQRLDMKLSAE
jgi:hypothetical protein